MIRLGKNLLKSLGLLALFILTAGFEYHLTIDGEGKFKVRTFKVETLSYASLVIEDEVDSIHINLIAYSDFNNDGLEDVLVSVFWNDNEMGKTYDYGFKVLTKFSYDGIYIPIYGNDGKGGWHSFQIDKKDYLTKVLTGDVGEKREAKLQLIIDGNDLRGAYIEKHGRPEDLKTLRGILISKNSEKNTQFSLLEKTGDIETGKIQGSFEQLVTSMNNTKIIIRGVRSTNSDTKRESFMFSSDYSGVLKGVNFVDNIEFVDEGFKNWHLNPGKAMTRKNGIAMKFEYLPWNKPSDSVKNKFPKFVVVDNCLDSIKYSKLEYMPVGIFSEDTAPPDHATAEETNEALESLEIATQHPTLQWQTDYSVCDLPALFRNASKPLKSYLSYKGQGNLIRDLLSRGRL